MNICTYWCIHEHKIHHHIHVHEGYYQLTGSIIPLKFTEGTWLGKLSAVSRRDESRKNTRDSSHNPSLSRLLIRSEEQNGFKKEFIIAQFNSRTCIYAWLLQYISKYLMTIKFRLLTELVGCINQGFHTRNSHPIQCTTCWKFHIIV